MELIKGVYIEELKPFSENEKGKTIEKSENPGKAYLLGYRNAGVHFGNHYHQGKSLSKNPEVLWLIEGEWNLSVRKLTDEKFTSIRINAPARIEIHPNVLHKIESITNSVFIEFNSLQEHIDDTAYPD